MVAHSVEHRLDVAGDAGAQHFQQLSVAAAKAGAVNLTKTAALELRPHRIRVTSILPGFAETELVTSKKQAYTRRSAWSSMR